MKIKLFLDRIKHPSEIYKESNWIIARDIQTVKSFLRKGIVDILSFGDDCGTEEETTYDLCLWMKDNKIWPNKDVWIHSLEPAKKYELESFVNQNFLPKSVDK